MERMRVANEEGSDARENDVSSWGDLGSIRVDVGVEAVRMGAIPSSSSEKGISRRLLLRSSSSNTFSCWRSFPMPMLVYRNHNKHR